MAADGLSPQSYQHITQLGLQRLIDASTGPSGPRGVTSYHLVPTNGYHNGQRLPYDVNEDLKAQSYDKRVLDGVEFYLIPEVSTNLPGQLSHYAQLTGVAELQNPPSGGVNRVRETLTDYADAVVDPEGVAKYVDENDAYEEARQKQSAEDEQLAVAVTKSPAREPAESKLVDHSDNSSEEVVVDDQGKTGGRKSSKETQQVDPTASE